MAKQIIHTDKAPWLAGYSQEPGRESEWIRFRCGITYVDGFQSLRCNDPANTSRQDKAR